MDRDMIMQIIKQANQQRLSGNAQAAIETAMQGLEYANATDYTDLTATANNVLGIIYDSIGDYTKSIEYYTISLELFSKINNEQGMARTMSNLGLSYINQGNYYQALQLFNQTLKIMERHSMHSSMAILIGNIGDLYTNLVDYDKALNSYLLSLQLHETSGDIKGQIQTLISLGNLSRKQADFDKALEYLYKAHSQAQGDPLLESSAKFTIGNVYNDQEEYWKALEYYQNCIDILPVSPDEYPTAIRAIANQGMIYANTGFVDYDPQKAEELLTYALKHLHSSGARQAEYEICNILSVLMKDQQRWQEFAEYFQRYHELEKEIYNQELQRQIYKLEYENLIAKVEQQAAIEKARAEEREAHVQELSRLNSELTKASKMKDEVIGIVAHDLKNPLASIIMNAEMIIGYHQQLSPTQILKIINSVLGATKKMNEIIHNLLDIQALDSGNLSLHPQPCSIKSIMEALVQEYSSRAHEKSITITLNIPLNMPTVWADPFAVRQILDNLLSNAIKYSPPGRAISISTVANQHTVQISVEDQGPGIPPEEVPMLFQRFQKLSARPTAGEHSTGLGLSIAHTMAHMMNGRLWYEQKSTPGALFIVELPVSR